MTLFTVAVKNQYFLQHVVISSLFMYVCEVS